MSRIRTIKPEFWTSEQVLSCSLNARLLFIGMWNFCDDNGVHTASYLRLKTEVVPADNFSVTDIQRFINELIQNGLLREYRVDDKAYWIVSGWKKHQRIDKPTSRYPLPQLGLKIADTLSNTIRDLVESLPSFPQQLSETSTTEGNGRERSGKDINICEVQTSLVDISESEINFNSCNKVFEYWKTTMNHPRAKLDNKRKRVISRALSLGYCFSDIKQAIDGCANTPYNMGKNDTGSVYDDIGLILRDADHIERFMNNGRPADHVSIGLNDIIAWE